MTNDHSHPSESPSRQQPDNRQHRLTTASRISRRQSIAAFLIFLVITFAAAGAGAVAGPDPWYRELSKPSFTPPDWVFGPVWTTLYFLMAIAAWNVWRRSPRTAALPIAAYLMQLVLNAAWTLLFFGLHRPAWALIDIGALWVAIAIVIALFAKTSRTSAALLLPYLAWVSFATFLNWQFVRLNP